MSYAKAWKRLIELHKETMQRSQADVLMATRDTDTIEGSIKSVIDASARWQQTQVYAGIIADIDAQLADEGDENDD